MLSRENNEARGGLIRSFEDTLSLSNWSITQDPKMKLEIVFAQYKFDNLVVPQNWEHGYKTIALQIKFLQVCQATQV